MDIAVVTGASSGLGLAISRRLLDLGFRVYGLGGNYSDSTLSNVEFRPVACDLADPGHVEAKVKEILEKENAITVLVNNAKYYPADEFVQGAPAEFARSLNVNLLCPLVLVRWCLEGLQRVRGCVINISSATPETSRGGPVGACTAGGLRWMQESLFQQLRDDGVAVSTIYPEPNRWRPEDAPPPRGERPQSAIDPQAVAEAVVGIVQNGRSNVITEIVIRPERVIERRIPPVRELPYPKPKPIPYTVPRAQIEAEERVDREEEERELGIGAAKKPEPAEEAPVSREKASAPDEQAPKKRRRGRGRGRGRGRDRESDERGEAGPRRDDQRETEGREEQRPGRDRDHRTDRRREERPDRREERGREKREEQRPEKRPERWEEAGQRSDRRRHREEDERPSEQPTPFERGQETREQASGRSRRRRGRKPRPVAMLKDTVQPSSERRPGPIPAGEPLASVPGPLARETVAPAPAPKPVPSEAGEPRPTEQKKAPAKKAPRKTTKAVKSAAKKAVARKTAVKKGLTKKAATKKTARKTVGKKAARKRTAKKTPENND